MQRTVAVSVLLLMMALPCLALAQPAGDKPAADGPTWLREDEAGAVAQAKRDGKLVLVDVWATSCHWCTKLDEDVFSTPEFAGAAKDFVLLKIDSDKNEGYLDKFGTDGLPTTGFLKPDGEVLGAVAGYMPAGEYLKVMSTAKALLALGDVDAAKGDPDRALRAALLWTSFNKADKAKEILTALMLRSNITADQAVAVGLAHALMTSEDDKSARDEELKAAFGAESVQDLGEGDALGQFLSALLFGWTAMPSGEPLALTLPGGVAMVIATPSDEEGLFRLVTAAKLAKNLNALPAPGGLAAEEVERAAATLLSVGLFDQALPYLEALGDKAQVDLLAAKVATGATAEAVPQVEALLAEQGLPPSTAHALKVVKAAALAKGGNAGQAVQIINELLADETVDPALRSRIRVFASESVLAKL